ncbi:PAS domain-containing sensor histidine kinase [Spongiactinospora sp. TRM90649]|uniref:sensor histidine kinase n=1 Tax=Spongiactinospora sp. TRM90649 TaxID=3031114 RepID=UPI0023F62DCE|nr:PAS domain-containing sensor histidine kinase [Spongiactinospora sp. TRM90649]MDF5752994.1 PAS domain-containing sensor histidine kinase [Spongiactinospora sp. TRM90649]
MGDEKVESDDSIAWAVLDSSPNAIVALDRDQTVLFWNAAAERLFGWSAEEMLGRRPPIVPHELTAEHNAVLERVRTGDEVSLRTKRFRRDGGLIGVRADISALRYSSAAMLGYVCVYHLVQDDEDARHRGAQRERLVRRLTNVVGDINSELELPAVLDRIAASLTELTGADAGGFVLIEGERLRLVSRHRLPASLRDATADLRTSLVGKLLRTGKTVLLETQEQEIGKLIWAELPGLHSIALGIAAVGGRPYGALYALFSRRKPGHVELELLELLAGHAGIAVGNAMAYQDVLRQRAHERAVFDASADGIAVLDRNGVVIQWNPAAGELTGHHAGVVLGGPPPFPLPAPGEKATFQLPSGVWLDVVSAEIPETGEIVVDFRDVTRAKELEEAKDLFLAITSHELRTPITVVRGFAGTLDARWDMMTDAERRAAVHTIAERARSLGRLMDHLLLGARTGAEELAVRAERFDLGELVHRATLGMPALSAGHKVEVVLPDELPKVVGDPLATDIMLGQLLDNAFKYSPDGGLVRVEAWPEAGPDLDGYGGVVVVVDDEGVGIAAADRERIFERFVQLDSGDRRRFGGVGLGLYIVRNLARAQGGDVSAHPRPGGGTRMRLFLPRATTSTDIREG